MKALRHPLLDAVGVEHGFGGRGLPPPGLGGRSRCTARSWRRRPAAWASAAARADAVVSALPGVPVGVVTADCVPILVADGGMAVAAIHAGWRGLACGVVAAAIEALRAESESSPRLVAAIGPHIGACCYEVDDPVLEALAPAFGGDLAAALRPARPGHAWLDLGRLAQTALLRAGLAPSALGLLPRACTRCDPVRFHSHRREGAAAGRLHHFIAARGTQA
jgi:YfiH family protein